MKVLLVNPDSPWPCGVRDFATSLHAGLIHLGVNVVVAKARQRGFSLCSNLRDLIQTRSIDVVHLQYPISALRPSPIQHILPLYLRVPIVVTLHEYSELHLLRRLYATAFLYADKLVFTNTHEFSYFSTAHPSSKHRLKMIPIGSNIPSINNSGGRRSNVIAYFGLVRPNRGIEQFLDLAELSHQRGRPYLFKLIGAVAKGKECYYKAVLRRSTPMRNIQWKLQLDATRVAHELATSNFAYLWYPDGASEKRGSLLAAMGNGAIVITRKGKQTPAGLASAVIYSDNCEHALSEIDRLASDKGRSAELRIAAFRWISKRSWSNIATQYKETYQSLLGDGSEIPVTD